jgi:uncharacterized protein
MLSFRPNARRKDKTMLTLKIVVASLAAGALAVPAFSQTIQINRDNKTIAISTTDEATATADLAAITVGFEIFGPESEGVYADAGKLSHSIIDALHKTGIKDESIESSAQGLQKNTEFDDKDKAEDRAKKRFVFSQSWEVTVSPTIAAEVIRAAVAAGANQSGAIDWRLSDRKALQAKAAESALVKARAVANQMAEGLHVKLGALIYASNQTPNARIYFANSGLAGGGGGGNASIVPGPPPPPPLEIRPQTIREEATVYAVFAIE